MSRVKRDLVRVTINLPRHVHESIKDFAESSGLSFTTAVMILCVDSLADKGQFSSSDKE